MLSIIYSKFKSLKFNFTDYPSAIISTTIIAASWLIPNITLRMSVMIIGLIISGYKDILKYQYMAISIGYMFWFMKSIKAVEYINYEAQSRYGIARYNGSEWILSTYRDSLVLCDDGLIKLSGSSYYFWLPLKRNERILHILSTNLPDFNEISSLPTMREKAVKIEYEYRRLHER